MAADPGLQPDPATANIAPGAVTTPPEPKLRTVLSPRLGFAALLWLCALVAPGLFLVHLVSPTLAVESTRHAELVLTQALWMGLFVLGVGALLYPPFLPSARIGLRRIRDRLSVDQAPMYRALEELRHLETAANHVAVARTMRSMGNLRGALAHAGRAAELDPDSVAARFLFGSLLREAGRPQASAEELTFVVQREPGHAFGEAQAQLGHALLQAGREAEALEVLQDHGKEFGRSRKTAFLVARAHRAQGHAEEARQALREAAAPPREGERLTSEDRLFRARARVGQWFRGGRR